MYNVAALEGQRIAATSGRIEMRIAQIVDRITLKSALQQNSGNWHQQFRTQISATLSKYRSQIVAAVAAFRAKLSQFLAHTITREEFAAAVAALRVQIIEIIKALAAELKLQLRVNLDEIAKSIRDGQSGNLTQFPNA